MTKMPSRFVSYQNLWSSRNRNWYDLKKMGPYSLAVYTKMPFFCTDHEVPPHILNKTSSISLRNFNLHRGRKFAVEVF